MKLYLTCPKCRKRLPQIGNESVTTGDEVQCCLCLHVWKYNLEEHPTTKPWTPRAGPLRPKPGVERSATALAYTERCSSIFLFDSAVSREEFYPVRRELELEIAALRPVAAFAMALNSRRFLPVATKLERLETQLAAWPVGVESADLGRLAKPPNR